MNTELRSKVRNLPNSPGVYRFLNENGKIIYIGKAKSLYKRVGSY
ncbi:MAG: GIY-YIG nuclease family protein, partial [Bacteroidota bacterium]